MSSHFLDRFYMLDTTYVEVYVQATKTNREEQNNKILQLLSQKTLRNRRSRQHLHVSNNMLNNLPRNSQEWFRSTFPPMNINKIFISQITKSNLLLDACTASLITQLS